MCSSDLDHKPKAAFQHLEKKYFEVGDLGFRVWKFLNTITGMLICNDRRWPEAFRVLALQGAELAVKGDTTAVTSGLGISFNSTLVALTLSILLMYLLHEIQLAQERLVLDAENYVDEELVSRLHRA